MVIAVLVVVAVLMLVMDLLSENNVMVDRRIVLVDFFSGRGTCCQWRLCWLRFCWYWAKAGLRPARPRLDRRARIQFCGVLNQKM